MMRYFRFGMVVCGLLSAALSGIAQTAAPIGKGSYASSPPPDVPYGAQIQAVQKQDLYLVKETGRPIPTNKWWTQLVVSRFARSLWTFPLKVDTSERGLDIFFPTKWQPEGNDPQCDFPLNVSGARFKPADARAKDWSDSAVSFRMAETPDRYFDVTLGEGMPCVWIEYHGVQPELTLPGGADAQFFDLSGRVGTLPVSGDCFGISYQNRQYGIFVPDGTRFVRRGSALDLQFSGHSQYVVVCPLPSAKDIGYFHRYAYAVPRDTQLSWKVDSANARVTTSWKVTAEPLRGTNTQIIQGWIPHHYRGTVSNLAFNNIDYLSPRGKLRCTVGDSYEISYSYSGIIPNLPAPRRIGGSADYDATRMHWYLSTLAAKPQFGADTYWGGKDILRFGQCAMMARQTKDSNYGAFVSALRMAMADWYTYRPGKKDHYFAYYPRWKSLVGINPSYGSEAFNDHHFHYGYFTFASALLAADDPKFAADYGEMATLVAKDYANWDRTDKRFPFLRTFDAWAGHSWAGGTSSPGGENQESSSEAVQSWAGLIFLGQALGDAEMRDAGIMGYAMETQATLEYWFNVGGDVFPPEWKHSVAGMVWSGGKVYGTYFTGDPAWIYGIQWLPASPMLSYLVRDPARARKSYADMERDYAAHEASEAAKPPKPGERLYQTHPATIRSFGSGLGSVMLGYRLMYDPNWAAEQLDELWRAPGDDIAHNASEMAAIYYQAHSMRSLGRVDWECWGSSPTSMVYWNEATKIRTFVVWNPTSKSVTVAFRTHEKTLGRLAAAPGVLTSAASLAP